MTTEPAGRLAERRIRESLDVQDRLLEPATVAAVVRAANTWAPAGGRRNGARVRQRGQRGGRHAPRRRAGRALRARAPGPAGAVALRQRLALTAISNDYGYERVFARQVEALGIPSDVALGISTSGRSANVLAGLEAARAHGLGTLALTGGDGGSLPEAADVCIVVPSAETPRIQEGHTLLAHRLCELVEQAFA